jgi:hypothetical protein
MAAAKDPGLIEFDAPILRYDGGGSFVEAPCDVAETFGTLSRVPVLVRYDGEDYRGSLAPYGGRHLVVIPLTIQEAIGKSAGDVVHVELRLDTAERVVELDEATTETFASAGVLDRFRAMSYSHQREYWQWISGAKKDETQQARRDKAVAMISAGERLKG